jgi:hypothetical protein
MATVDRWRYVEEGRDDVFVGGLVDVDDWVAIIGQRPLRLNGVPMGGQRKGGEERLDDRKVGRKRIRGCGNKVRACEDGKRRSQDDSNSRGLTRKSMLSKRGPFPLESWCLGGADDLGLVCCRARADQTPRKKTVTTRCSEAGGTEYVQDKSTRSL